MTSSQEIDRIGKQVKYHHEDAINIIQTNDLTDSANKRQGWEGVGEERSSEAITGPRPCHTDRERQRERELRPHIIL